MSCLEDLVAVFPSLENVQWPIEVACEDITGIGFGSPAAGIKYNKYIYIYVCM